MNRKELLGGAKRIVVKIGTSTLTNADGSLNERLIKSLVAQICKLKDTGFCVALVSSGAVGAGMGLLGIAQRPKILSRKQALAAVGQVALMHLYERLFWAHDRIIAQLLLSRDDFSDRARYLSVRNVCAELLSRGIVPIINENDPVVADELKVGDNDTLSALVAGLIDADLLVILSDIDGLYDKNPSEHTDAKLLSFIEKIDERVVKMAGGEGSKFGTGGMATKIAAAQMANQIGTSLIIANGRTDGILLKIAAGEEVGTLFSAGAAWAYKEANPARIFIAANDEDQGGTLNRAEREKAVAPKNIKLKFSAQGAAWAAKFNEPDADKKGELDVLELRGYEPADYVKAPCANWN